jgi:ribosomal protein S18 acetylase RimI-like enzyme
MVHLVPMSEADYAGFLEWAIADYAQQQIEAQAWSPDDARHRAEEAFQHLLPEGLSTANQHLCTIVDSERGEQVGFLWYGLRSGEGDPFVALYEFVILEPYRRQGYGRAALQALEERVKELGMDRILLHVFGHNAPAKALYSKMGYLETNVTMAKRIA